MEKNEKSVEKTNNGSEKDEKDNNSNDNPNDQRDVKATNLKIKISLDHQEIDKETSSENVVVSNIKENNEAGGPDVKMLSLTIITPGRSDIVLTDPVPASPKASLFSLKEGITYRIKFYFIVSKETVNGLKYISHVYKNGVRVDKSIVLIGTYAPREEPYEYELPEDRTPSGVFVRGRYSAKVKVEDDKGICYFNVGYYFDIHKSWPT